MPRRPAALAGGAPLTEGEDAPQRQHHLRRWRGTSALASGGRPSVLPGRPAGRQPSLRKLHLQGCHASPRPHPHRAWSALCSILNSWAAARICAGRARRAGGGAVRVQARIRRGSGARRAPWAAAGQQWQEAMPGPAHAQQRVAHPARQDGGAGQGGGRPAWHRMAADADAAALQGWPAQRQPGSRPAAAGAWRRPGPPPRPARHLTRRLRMR